MAPTGNEDQIEAWNGEVGRKWLRLEQGVEAVAADVSDALLERAALVPGDRVLEVGCGGGGLSLRLAQAVGPGGRVLGLDVSAPLLARAEARRAGAGLSQLAFQEGDAQTAALPEGEFTHLVSQFGVMFFADPVAAFANLRRALRPGGRALLAAQGPLAENPFFALGRAVAVARLGLPPPAPDGPGPFAFADRDKVVGLLAAAGFAGVRAEARPSVYRAASLDEVVEMAMQLGPGGSLLRVKGGTEEDRAAVREGLRGAFAAFATPEGVAIPGRFNLFEARRD